MSGSPYVEIDLSYDYGSLFGYIVNSKEENLENWMEDREFSQTSLTKIRSQYQRVAIIKSLFIEEGERGNGCGTELMEQAIVQAQNEGADAILLEADTAEKNKFDLVEWYEDVFNFTMVEKKESFPLMILEC